jgi:hypothetical protein
MRNILAVFIATLILSISSFAQSETKPCPTIKMTSPAGITNPGETMTFSVKLENEKDVSNLKYEWTVLAGTMVEGQFTSAITVATTPEMGGSTVTAKVSVQGLPSNCSNEAVETAAIAPMIGCVLLDDYGKVSSGIEKAMLDGLFANLLNNPEFIVFFRLGREENETIKQTKSRIKRIVKLANFRRIDKKLLVFVVSKSEKNPFGYLTSAYLIPKNKKFPECENCEIIKGEDVK